MFQSFDETSDPSQSPARIAALRNRLKEDGLSGFLVPRADRHMGEYVAPCDERLAWLTGFTGSAGFAAILGREAGIFIDGRYKVQVRAQVDLTLLTPVDWPDTRLGPWLAERVAKGDRIGFDPWLHTADDAAALSKALEGAGAALVAVDNLVDRIWADRPDPPSAPAEAYPAALAGAAAAEKRAQIAEVLEESGEESAVLTLPDSIAWLLNIRGADIARIPVVQAFAILRADGSVTVFSDPAKFAELDLGFEVEPWEAFESALSSLEGPVRVDPKSAPVAVFDRLEAAGSKVSRAPDPCQIPKACKTEAEIEGTRAAHLRDAAAMVEFLAWLDARAPRGRLTEIEVASTLEGFRRATNALRDISFDTISGAGPNGAIVHYRVTERTNREVSPGELLLVDSGGQYLDGTTDITRTVAIGPAGDEERRAFTLVLKGMIAISRARFPRGVAGAHLDALARYPLWLAGLDYDHGTGHGVGAYLSVHEGPQRLSRLGTEVLRPGMILSNEPGYYREGAFGIRIENLIVTREAPALPGADDREMLDFETLTWVPIDRRLIDAALLDTAERAWLDGYHAQVAARLEGRLSEDAAAWLAEAAAPL